ncbi:cytochrome c biogenesis protein CcsA [Planctomycetota bacterium]|nr:cytochrome c biogenesis protein CcsA [Planctomycetota bacterium]
MKNETNNKAVYITLALAVLGLIGVQITQYMVYNYAPTQMTSGAIWIVEPDGGSPISLYESYRIFFTHLPSAYTTAVCSMLSAFGGVMWLLSRKDKWEALVVSAAETGLVVGAMVLLTGSFWADYAWGNGQMGSGWNWEPRLTTMLILWLAFASLLVLRWAMDSPKQRKMMTAIYGILLGPMYPLVSKAIEIGQTSHPKSFSSLLSADAIDTTKSVAQLGMGIALVSLIALRYAWNRVGQGIQHEMSR